MFLLVPRPTPKQRRLALRKRRPNPAIRPCTRCGKISLVSATQKCWWCDAAAAASTPTPMGGKLSSGATQKTDR